MIVAADDDEDDVNLLRMLFRRAGVTHRFEVFGRGEDVITALAATVQRLVASAQAALPLVCFLDIKMPAMTGHEVLRWIRSQSRLDPMPVVMLSSSEHPSDVRQAAENGAQCYLIKYPRPEVLQQVISDAERIASGTPASQCFAMSANLLRVAGAEA
ncbi:MAG: response regulator [Verrucomicrobiota bacterium]